MDRFNEWFVSAYVSPSGVRFLLLHDVGSLDNVRLFFNEVNELYIKVCCTVCILYSQCLLNPFYEVGSVISSKVFDARVKQLCKKYL